MQQREDIIPIVGLNKDDDPRHFEKGDYEDAFCVHVGATQEEGQGGLVSSVVSHAQTIMPGDWGSASNVVDLGVAKDEQNDKAYILKYGEIAAEGRFGIIKHDLLTDTLKEIWNVLASDWGIKAWDDDMRRCYNPVVVDGNLIWTDNENDIRMINVDKAEATTDAGIDRAVVAWLASLSWYTGYNTDDLVYYSTHVYRVLQPTIGMTTTPDELPTYYDELAVVLEVYLNPIDPNNFTLAALPPLIAPTATYYSDNQRNVNQLRGKTWQFTYQYVYLDYRKSTWAPPSLVPKPDLDEKIDGSPNTNTSWNNAIKLKVYTGGEEVRYIRIAARTSEDPSTWFIIEELYCINDNNARVISANSYKQDIYFYNDKLGEVLDLSKVATLFSYVPIRAKHMELVEGNRLVFGNITEGYDRIVHDVTVDLNWENITAYTVARHDLSGLWWYRHIGFIRTEAQLVFNINFTNPGACTFYIKINRNDGAGEQEASYVYNGTDSYPTAVITGLIEAFDLVWPGETDICWYPNAYKFCRFPTLYYNDSVPEFEYWGIEFYYEKALSDEVYKYRQLKTGATHSWAMIYRDVAGRITPPIGSGEITKYIPFPTENTDSNVGRKPLISFNINHVPPPQAESYEIIYAGNKSTSWHLQLMGCNFTWGKTDHDNPDENSEDVSNRYYRLRVNNIQGLTRDTIQNWSTEEYVWEKGDRIRIIGKVSSLGILTEINDDIYDVEITGVYQDTDYAIDIGDSNDIYDTSEVQDQWIYFPIKDIIIPGEGPRPNLYPDNLYVEIYRPYKVETNLFYTTGMTFKIETDVYGNKYHKGNTDQVLDSDGNPDTPAIVQNTSHDNWKYFRNFSNVLGTDIFHLWTESEYPSDFYIFQKLTSQGNPVPDLDSVKQNVLTKRLRHGGKTNIGSELNQIAKFDYDDYLDLKDENGPIEGLRFVGFVLKVLQYNKETSIYINRQESFTASGEAQYLFTDKVFGSTRPEMENWGTKHPSSVIVNNRHLYYWDESEGIVVRSAANGQVAISDYKMKRKFREISSTLKAYSPQRDVRVYFAFSKATNQLFCLMGAGLAIHDCWVFSEDDGRWKARHGLRMGVGLFYWIGKRLFETAGFTYLFEWWAGTDYNRFTYNIRSGDYAPKLIFYAVVDPAKVKTFEAVHMYQTGYRPVFNAIEIDEKATAAGDGPMITTIHDVNIEEREGVFYCQILRDRNTPGPGTQDEKEMNGRKMRGLYCKIEVELQDPNNTNHRVVISNIAVVTTPSERSK